MLFLYPPQAPSINLAGTTSGIVNLSVAAAAGTHTIKLPTADGSANQIISTDGSGQWGWATQYKWTFSSQSNDFTAGTAQMTFYLWTATDPFGGTPNMTLPAASGNTGLMVGVQRVAGTASRGIMENSSNVALFSLYSTGDYVILISDGTNWLTLSKYISSEEGYTNPSDFRLSTEFGVPVSSSNRTSQGTIYLTPMGIGNRLLIPNLGQTGFDSHRVNNLYWTIGGSSGNIKDLYVWNNAGVPTTVLSPAWSSNTSRGTGAGTAEQDTLWNITVNKVAIGSMPAYGGIYVGTIRLTGTDVTEDSVSNRFVINFYNEVLRVCKSTDDQGRNTTSASPVQIGSTQFSFISLGKHAVHVQGASSVYTASGQFGMMGVGTGATTLGTNTTQPVWGSGGASGMYIPALCVLNETPSLGLVTYYLLYRSLNGGTVYVDGTAYGSGGKPGTVLEANILC